MPDSDSPTPERVIGLDFSAAARASGANSWIADCRFDGETLRVERLATASEWLGLDTTERDPVLAELADRLADPPEPTVVGMDFPFSLPAEFLGFGDGGDSTAGGTADGTADGNHWRSFLRGTPTDWGILDDVADPRDLYDRVTATAEEQSLPLSRQTDDANGGQNPAGFRIKTQTFYGISALLRPLVERRNVRVAPVLDDPTADLTVMETYPAAVFDALPDAVRDGYKDDDRASVANRRQNRAALRDAGVEIDGVDADAAVATDDALDAVAAAYAAAMDFQRAVSDSFTPRERVEAVIFDGTSE